MLAFDQMPFRSEAIADDVIDAYSIVVHTSARQCLPAGVRFTLVWMQVTERVDKSVVVDELREPETRRTGIEMLKVNKTCVVIRGDLVSPLLADLHQDHRYR